MPQFYSTACTSFLNSQITTLILSTEIPLVSIPEIWSPYISTQARGKIEMKRDSLAEFRGYRNGHEAHLSLQTQVAVKSSQSELLIKTSGRKKKSLFILSLYIHLSSYLLLFPPMLHYSLSPLVLFHLSVSSCQDGSLASAGRQTGLKAKDIWIQVCVREKRDKHVKSNKH